MGLDEAQVQITLKMVDGVLFWVFVNTYISDRFTQKFLDEVEDKFSANLKRPVGETYFE